MYNRKLYCCDDMKNNFSEDNLFEYEKKTKLSVLEIENGIIHPFQYIKNENGNTVYPCYGGVTDEDFHLVEESLLLRRDQFDIVNNKPIRVYGKIQKSVDINCINYLNDEIVFLGLICDFYGHFLVDSLNRLWYFLSRENREKKACYIADGNSPYLEFFEFFGLDKEQLIRIDKPTKIKKILIPEQSFRYHDFYHKKYKETINQIKKYIKPEKYDKIYFSRSKYKGMAGTFGEEVIEEIFKKNGFHIFYPEKLAAKYKLSLMVGAKQVAGTTGTGMHNILFANDGIDCFYLNRSQHILPVQSMIDQMKEINAVYIDSYYQPLPITYFSQPFLIGLTQQLVSFFQDYHFKFSINTKMYKSFYDALLHFLAEWAYINSNYKLFSGNISAEILAKKISEIFNFYSIEKFDRRKSIHLFHFGKKILKAFLIKIHLFEFITRKKNENVTEFEQNL